MTFGGKNWTKKSIGRMFGRGASKLVQELLDFGVMSQGEDGAFYSRRMVRDEHIRTERQSSGAQGGKASIVGPGYAYAIRRESDNAVKLGCSKSPESRVKQIRSRQGTCCALLAEWPVSDMNAAERVLHAKYIEQRLTGEWFTIDELDADSLWVLLQQRGIARATDAQPLEVARANVAAKPGSSSSSSSSSSPSGKILRNTETARSQKSENSELMIRVGSWFNRKPTTPWTDKERKKMGDIEKSGVDTKDLDALEVFYKAPTEEGCYIKPRVSLITLLNNWPGEIDKANQWVNRTKSETREEKVGKMLAQIREENNEPR